MQSPDSGSWTLGEEEEESALLHGEPQLSADQRGR